MPYAWNRRLSPSSLSSSGFILYLRKLLAFSPLKVQENRTISNHKC